MDNLETQPGAQPDLRQPDVKQLQEQLEGLRHTLTSILVLVVILSGALNLFMLRQAKYVRADLAAARPQVAAIVNEYNKVNAPAINDFVKRLVDYGQKHPDFNAKLIQYGIVKAATNAPSSAKAAPLSPAAAAPATTPAPTPAPAPAKK